MSENQLRERMQQITTSEFGIINKLILKISKDLEKQREHTHKNDSLLNSMNKTVRQL